MADASLLSVLAGQDPASAQMLDALHTEQARQTALNPETWRGGGLAGGLASIIAGAVAPSASSQVANIAAQRTAARPDEAKLLASPDPFTEAANNPGAYNPLALAHIREAT